MNIVEVRRGKKQQWAKRFFNNWKSWAKKNRDISWVAHSIVIINGIILSISFYLIFLLIFRPHFSVPKTTAINWYTVHHYPHQQDYFFYATATITVVAITFFIWVLWIWEKNKK